MKRHTVKIVDHDEEWSSLAKNACQAIRDSSKDLICDVQHVGSTAVPGLSAKPILDIAVAIKNFEVLRPLIKPLMAIGYIDRGFMDKERDNYLLVFESSPDMRTIHVHIVDHNGCQWKNYIRFRDLLRENDVIRSKYADLKAELKERCQNDRKKYTASKRDFIQGALNEK